MSIHYTSDGEPRPNYDPELDDELPPQATIIENVAERDSDGNDFLNEYLPEREWARRHGICQKTVARYRNQPDGLPYLEFGGKIFIPVEDGADWIRSLVTQRNPKRRNPSSRKGRTARRTKIEAKT